MKNFLFSSVLIIVISCTLVAARNPQTGHLVVALTDKLTGAPITNATVTVKTLRVMGLNSGAHEGHYVQTSARTGTNGVAEVEFQFLTAHFQWWVTAPEYWCQRNLHNECFSSTSIPSTYLNINTNTVEGMSKYNELINLYQSGRYGEYAMKFDDQDISFKDKVICRSESYYPKRNPQPMYCYSNRYGHYLSFDEDNFVYRCGDDGIVQFPIVEFDLKKCAFLPPYAGEDDDRIGEVADLRFTRRMEVVDGVTNYFGSLSFPSGGGAYKHPKTDDKFFPTTYEADTNVEYVTDIPYRYAMISNEVTEIETLLSTNEYMVLRTRVSIDSQGCMTNCFYSKFEGEAWVGNSFNFRFLMFNPRPNDTNLESDSKQNLAHGKIAY